MVYSPFLFSTRKLAGTGVIHQLSAFYFYFSAAHAASFNKSLNTDAHYAPLHLHGLDPALTTYKP
jgi:hypothetical protein